MNKFFTLEQKKTKKNYKHQEILYTNGITVNQAIIFLHRENIKKSTKNAVSGKMMCSDINSSGK